MTKDYTFLGHFISEEIYLVDSNPSKDVEKRINKEILIVSAPLLEEEEKFLQKIFAAVEISPDQLSIVHSEKPISQQHSLAFYFGIQPTIENKELYKKHRVNDSDIVLAHRLSEIAHDESRKRELWTVLKACFN